MQSFEKEALYLKNMLSSKLYQYYWRKSIKGVKNILGEIVVAKVKNSLKKYYYLLILL